MHVSRPADRPQVLANIAENTNGAPNGAAVASGLAAAARQGSLVSQSSLLSQVRTRGGGGTKADRP